MEAYSDAKGKFISPRQCESNTTETFTVLALGNAIPILEKDSLALGNAIPILGRD